MRYNVPMDKTLDTLKSQDRDSMSEQDMLAYVTLLEAEAERLEAKSKKLEDEHNALIVECKKLEDEHIAECKRLKAQYDAEIDKFIELVRIANARYWGAKSEKILPHQLSLFNDCEAVCDNSTEPSLEEVVFKAVRKAKRKISVDLATSDLPKVVIEHTLSGDEGICPVCADSFSEMKVETTYKLKKIPAHLEIEEHRRHVYICNSCSQNNAKGKDIKAQIVRAPMPAPPIERSFATPSLIASVIYDKYTRSLPLYRIEQDFIRTSDIHIPRNTLAAWMMSVSNRWFSKIYEAMKSHLLCATHLFADETRVQVLKEPKRKPSDKSYMWVWTTGADEIPITLFEYSESRSAQIPKDFLGGKTDFYLQCDGYQVYKKLDPGITVCACLSHARRKFTDIVKAIPKSSAKTSIAYEAVERLDHIFHIDHTFSELTASERKERRDKELKAHMEAFFVWAKVCLGKATPGMSLYKALQYALNQQPYIMNVFLDGRLELSSNRVERAIRPFAIARRNFLFSDTPNGAEASAVLFSVVQTAIANKLKPFEYLCWVLTEMPQCDLLHTPESVTRFLPWSKEVPEYCRLKLGEQTQAEAEEPILLPSGIDTETIEAAIESFEEESL